MLFADHTSRHATINYQTSLAGGETSLSHFECVESSCGVTINHNHADNGTFAAASFYKNYVPINHIFTAASFRKDRITINHNHAEDGIFTAVSFCEDCTLKNQELSFSAANSHHQNEVAERYIQSITCLVRAMLLHSALHWPKEDRLTDEEIVIVENKEDNDSDHGDQAYGNDLVDDDGTELKEHASSNAGLILQERRRSRHCNQVHLR